MQTSASSAARSPQRTSFCDLELEAARVLLAIGRDRGSPADVALIAALFDRYGDHLVPKKE